MATQARPSGSRNFLTRRSPKSEGRETLEVDILNRLNGVTAGYPKLGLPHRKDNKITYNHLAMCPFRARKLKTRGAISRPPHLWTDVALIGLSVIWGINFSVIKIALREFDPLAFNAVRFTLASLTLFVFLRLTGAVPFPERRHWGHIVSLGLLANVVYQLLFIYGVDRTLAGNAGLVLATTPVWTLILASISGQEHHRFPIWGGVLATLGGMVLVVLGGEAGLGSGEGLLMGDLLLVLAAITWAAYTVGTQDLTREYGALAVTSWTLCVGTIGLVALGGRSLWSMDFRAISGVGWFGAVYSGVFAIAVAYLI